jgi:hypothetical protein
VVGRAGEASSQEQTLLTTAARNGEVGDGALKSRRPGTTPHARMTEGEQASAQVLGAWKGTEQRYCVEAVVATSG